MSEVVVVRWPEEGDDAAQLVHAGAAVLYLVAPDDEPPVPASCLEDWVRVPGGEQDLVARLAALERRAALHHSPPSIDDAGVLHFQGRLVQLSPREARLAGALAVRFEEAVSDGELLARALSGEVGMSSLRLEVAHLRTRLRQVGLSIRRTRGRGYTLHSY